MRDLQKYLEVSHTRKKRVKKVVEIAFLSFILKNVKICLLISYMSFYKFAPVIMFDNYLVWPLRLFFVTCISVVNTSTSQLKGYGTVVGVNSKIRKMKGEHFL